MKIAIILSGCGNRDGSELQETLSLMLALDRRDIEYHFFAPQGQLKVVSHCDGAETGELRDLYAESARIARGAIRPLSHYLATAAEYEVLALPGGMGAARNLSTYAFDGTAMTVLPEVHAAILDAYEHHKPVMAMCIAPMVLAKVLGQRGVTLTLGGENDAAAAARALGATTQCCGPTEVCVDADHHVLTTPAYMAASRIAEIFAGADNMVEALLRMLRK